MVWIVVMSLLVSACGAASEVGSEVPTTLNLFDAGSTVTSEVDDSQSAASSTTKPTDDEFVDDAPDTTELKGESTTTLAVGSTQSTAAPSTTVRSAPTIPTVDPNAKFCQAAIYISDLGTFVALDDTEAATTFFNAQADRWDAAAAVAPASIAADARTVATFVADLRSLLAANDFDLFAVFEEVTELETTSGSDVARIRTDQFIYANCEVIPPLPEQATAVFYGELLETAADREFLAELLASAEVFPLDGARCFVDRAAADVMHPLVGAPATPAQDAALASVLSACQLSIGT